MYYKKRLKCVLFKLPSYNFVKYAQFIFGSVCWWSSQNYRRRLQQQTSRVEHLFPPDQNSNLLLSFQLFHQLLKSLPKIIRLIWSLYLAEPVIWKSESVPFFEIYYSGRNNTWIWLTSVQHSSNGYFTRGKATTVMNHLRWKALFPTS